MPYDANHIWIPDPAQVVPLFDTPDGPHLISLKQLEIMRACREPTGRPKVLFIEGPKFSGKSQGCAEAIPDHLYNINGASICVLTTSIGTGDDSGIWSEITEKVLPAWISGDFGFSWWKGDGKKKVKPGPKMKGASKKLYCELTNKFGTKSHIELNSVADERDCEKAFFGRQFSMVYWPELQMYRDSKTFKTILQTLRMPNIPEGDFVLLCDGNPSDQGQRSWQYQLFWQFASRDDISDDEKPLQRMLKRIHVPLETNPFLSDDRKREIRSFYKDDVSLYARYVLGEWVESSQDALFRDVFKPAIHIAGELGPDPELLVPSEHCSELRTSWDFGPANPAVVFYEQTFPDDLKVNGKQLSRFLIFDELVLLDVEEMTLADFTEMVMGKMSFWERVVGHPVQWTHYSDRSVLDTRDPIANQLQHTEVLQVSEGKINLVAVDRKPGSISAGIRLWRRLLAQQRVSISSECTNLIAAQTGLTPQRNSNGVIPFSIARGNRHKHVFDALRYGLTADCWEEMMESINETRIAKRSDLRVLNVKM